MPLMPQSVSLHFVNVTLKVVWNGSDRVGDYLMQVRCWMVCEGVMPDHETANAVF